MPSAGGIAPPTIIPLRNFSPSKGKNGSTIDTCTFVQLQSETSDVIIYFTTNNTKPNPFKLNAISQESTFKYKGPFTLKPGKRILKVMAISNDGLTESNVLTKTFQVNDAGPPQDFAADPALQMQQTLKLPNWTKKDEDTVQPVEAWSTSNGIFDPNYLLPETPRSSGFTIPYNDRAAQFGEMTKSMLQNLSSPKQADLTEWKAELSPRPSPIMALPQQPPLPPPEPIIKYIKHIPEAKPYSPGAGDWEGQLEHIYAHLRKKCAILPAVRTKIGQPVMGKVLHIDIDEDDTSYLLTIALERPEAEKSYLRVPQTPKKIPERRKSNNSLAQINPRKPDPPIVKDSFFETEEYEAEGTLHGWPNFNSERDCELLRKAMKGVGTDEKLIINILGYRSSVQRVEICSMFKTMFGKDLVNELKGELSGNLKKAITGLCQSPADFDANCIRNATKGIGTDERCLIEILCTRTKAQIKQIKKSYQKLFGADLASVVKSDTSANFKKMLTSLIMANREESTSINGAAAKEDALKLFKAGEGKWGTDESVFNKILCHKGFAHIRAVFGEYENLSKRTMEEAIKREFSGDIKKALLAVVQVIKNKPLYFAMRIHQSMKGLGTDDSSLVRIVVSRCECDMVQIKEAFQEKFGQKLDQYIEGDTSGSYRLILLALIGERDSPVLESEDDAIEPPELEEIEDEHIEQTGTIEDFPDFNAKSDAEVLRKAMKGFGTNENAIISVWGFRSKAQRQEIKKTFRAIYNKDLMKELKSELSGNFRTLVMALGMTNLDYDVSELRKAMKGLGTDENTLIEILCSRETKQLAEIKEAYSKQYSRNLEKDLISECSGHFKRLLVSMVQANRPENTNSIDRAMARRDAKALYEAGVKSWGTDESRFNVVLCTRSYQQLRVTFDEYSNLSRKEIEDSINSEMSGDIKNGMLTIVQCVRDGAQHFASRLHAAMKGLGTDDASLIRIIVSRCELDLVQIKQKFEEKYQQPLGQFIKDDTTGDYRKLILAVTNDDSLLKK